MHGTYGVIRSINTSVPILQSVNWNSLDDNINSELSTICLMETLPCRIFAYVGVIKTIVRSQVGDITTQILKLKEDVNYLLGQLSVTTSEFRSMATGLKKTLDGINHDTPAVTPAPGKQSLILNPYYLPTLELVSRL